VNKPIRVRGRRAAGQTFKERNTMRMRRPYLSALWLLLLVFPILPSSFAQTSGSMEVKVSLLEPLDTSKTKAGALFSATVAEPVMSGKRTILARGTAVQGKVTEVTRPGRMKTPASITLVLTNIVGSHSANAFESQPLAVDGKSHAVRNVALIGGGAAAGAALGGVADGGKGALIGAGVGAAAGTATAYLTGKQELVLPVETQLVFVVNAGTLAPADVRAPRVVQTGLRRGSGDDASRVGRDRDQDAYDALIFSERDQAIIRAYFYSGSGGKLPPGLAKRNGNLPPGLEKRTQPFPAELNRQLPRLPAGYSRVFIEGRAANIGSDGRIIDVFVVF
jgi:hypothetical protein